MGWIRTNKAMFLMILLVTSLALVPLYGILFPPLTDLPHQILVNKLLWEKLFGVSNLDLEVSRFLGYRLSSALMVIIITFCKLFGISLVYLPKIVATVLISLHAMVVVTILYFGLENKSWKSSTLAVCFTLPAVVSMYSACWFMGFVGFTLALTLLIPAIFFTERFVRSGKLIDASLLFLSLLMAYVAHPFATTFWLLWCFSRTLAAIAMRTFFLEWKKIIFLGVLFLPIFLYHYLATAGTGLAPSSDSLLGQFPFVSMNDWYLYRFRALIDGAYLKADDAADSRVFGLVAIGLILFSTFLAFFSTRNKRAKKLMLSSILLIFISSWVNEKFIPTPAGNWLAYNFRFSSTVYAVCLAVAGMVLIRFLPVSTDRLLYKMIFVLLAFISVVASADHLIEVRKAYARFDPPARAYTAKLFNRQRPIGILLPPSPWYRDAQSFRRYSCLVEPDCNPAGTLFQNNGGDLYPVKLKSLKRLWPSKSPVADPRVESANAFSGGEGYAGGQFSRPRGIAADTNGNFYVADTGNSRVQKFDADGKFISAFGTFGEGEGEFKDPNGVALDAAGNVYIVDVSNHKLMRFGPDGKFEKEWKGPALGFDVPLDIAIGPNKQLYIADQGRARIVKFDPATEAFSSWGTSGNGDGQFNKPTGIAIGNELIFVADAGNNRIQVFDLDGKFVRQWEVRVWDRYVWHYPDVVFDEENERVYVTSGWTKEVLVFNPDGKFLETLKLDPHTELNNPSSMVLSKTNQGRHLYVLSVGSDIVDNGDPSVSVLKLTNTNSQ